ncbi:MAG: NAD(P)H-dependent oxidoreductase [Eubacterium sp.]|nr:NAD(P)H-dependent oxidoreductase [Eubacterium sp.]
MILFINACVRKDSRTKGLTDCLLSELVGQVEEISLEEVSFPIVDEAFLNKRDRLIAAGDYTDSMFDLAKQFAQADCIVMAAPYWDLSFPASLKQYIELINVLGITFTYSPEGIPQGLCRAKKLYYVMTAGGNYVPLEYGFGYVKALAQNFYGIREVQLIKAVGLDIMDADPKKIIKESMEKIRQQFRMSCTSSRIN